MANITKNDVQALLEPGLKKLFMENYLKYNEGASYKEIATEVASSQDTENYGWLADLPEMREFIDERVINSIGEQTYYLPNKTWENTIGVNRAVLEDEQYGQIQMRINQLAKNTSSHKDKLTFQTLIDGATNLCFDGKAFFATNHAYSGKGAYKGSQSNKGNLTLTADNLKTSITNMGKIKGSNGEVLGIIPDTLVVPPDLEWTAKELIESSQLGNSNTVNTLKGSLKLIVSPVITDVDSWYLLCCSQGIKPLIFQNRMDVEFTSLTKDSEEGFMRDVYLYGVRARYNVGYSYWQLAYANIPA